MAEGSFGLKKVGTFDFPLSGGIFSMCFCGLEMGRRASRKDRQSANRACEMLPGAHNLSLEKLKLSPQVSTFVIR